MEAAQDAIAAGAQGEEDELHEHADYAVEGVEDAYFLGACISSVLCSFRERKGGGGVRTESESTGEFEGEFDIRIIEKILLRVV